MVPHSTVRTASAQVLDKLNGQIVRIPDLWPLFKDWPRGQSEGYASLKETLDLSLQGNSEQEKKLIKAADPALLTAQFWPEATKKEDSVLLFYVLWQGLMDENLESLESYDPAAAEKIRDVLCGCIDEALELQRPNRHENAPPAALGIFCRIAKPFAEGYPRGHLERLSNALHQYIHSTAIEHHHARMSEVPSYEDYFSLRKLTGGTAPLVTLAEYASDTVLPDWVVSSDAWTGISEAVCIIIGLTNDLLSFKREMYASSTLNAIAVISHEEPWLSLDQVVERIMAQISLAVKQFEAGEADLLSRASDSKVRVRIQMVLKTLKHNCTGNLSWSLTTPRYGLKPAGDGSVEMQLRTLEQIPKSPRRCVEE